MSIVYPGGSILDGTADVLVCPVNCRPGVMGAGLARAFADRYPGLKAAHRAGVEYGGLSPGGGHMVWFRRGDDYPGEGEAKGVYLLATKDDWRAPSRLEWVAAGLGRLAEDADGFCSPHYLMPMRSVAIPAVGCGLGGLGWADVGPLVLRLCESRPGVEWHLYPPGVSA